mgnify:CR=1 FL=1
MVKIRKPKKENDNILPIENTEALNDTLNKSEEFINNNKNIIYSVLGVIVLLILGFSAFSYFKENQNNTAQEEMFQAVYYFEKDSLGKKLPLLESISISFLPDIQSEFMLFTQGKLDFINSIINPAVFGCPGPGDRIIPS